jgi:hypothetical protein
MRLGDATNSAPPRLQKYLLGGSYPRSASTIAQKSAFALHNNKGGSRINFILRRPKLADILLAALFPSPCVLATRFELLAKSKNSLTGIILTLSAHVKIVNLNYGLEKSTFAAS